MVKRNLPRQRMHQQTVRVAIYLRVSTNQQLEGYGLKVQEEQCRAWVAYALREVRHTIVDVYVDGGVSGKLASREELDRLTADAMSEELDLIVFGKLDRIGRTMKNIHRWVYDVTDKGVRVATADGRIDSEDEMFGIQLSLLAYMAEVEHALILERTMGGRMQKLAAGGWPLGEPPYGLMLSADGMTAELNPLEIAVVEKAEELFVQSPETLTREEVARHLNALGYRTRRGKEWEGGNLAGRLLAGLKGYVDFEFAGENEDGQAITTLYRVEVPKTLPDDRAEALAAALARGSRTKAKHGRYLLSGRLFSLCGTHRTGATVPDSGERYYRCMGTREGVQNHDCWELPANEVEAEVWGEVQSLMGDKAKLHKLVDKWLGSVPDRVDSYRRRLAELDEQMEKKRGSRKRKIALLLASVEDDDDDASLVEELRVELKGQEDDLAQERERVAEWLADAEAQAGRAASMLALVDKVDRNMENFNLDQKIDLLDLLDVRVQIMGKGHPRHKGNSDPIAEWHRETGTPIPAEVTDEMWAKVEGILSSTRQWKDVRGGFEVMLDKVRTDQSWRVYSGDERIGGRSSTSLYRSASRWWDTGEYELALKALTPYQGVLARPPYVLPPMEVTGAVDARFTAEHAGHGRGDGNTVSCNGGSMSGDASPRWSSSG